MYFGTSWKGSSGDGSALINIIIPKTKKHVWSSDLESLQRHSWFPYCERNTFPSELDVPQYSRLISLGNTGTRLWKFSLSCQVRTLFEAPEGWLQLPKCRATAFCRTGSSSRDNLRLKSRRFHESDNRWGVFVAFGWDPTSESSANSIPS